MEKVTMDPKPLAELAIEIAIAAPAKRAKYVSDARVPWGIIEAIREQLDREGYDWREAHDRYLALLRERRMAARG